MSEATSERQETKEVKTVIPNHHRTFLSVPGANVERMISDMDSNDEDKRSEVLIIDNS
jgi:hypothetical protein